MTALINANENTVARYAFQHQQLLEDHIASCNKSTNAKTVAAYFYSQRLSDEQYTKLIIKL